MNANHLCLRAEGKYTTDHFQRVLRRFDEVGLLPITERDGAAIKRHVRVLTPSELTALEERLGVAGTRASNLRQAHRVKERYADWLFERLSDEEKIEAWGGM